MKTTNNKKSKFLALLLSVMMLSSMGAAFAACADDADSSSSSSSSSSSTTESNANDRVDNGTIKNSHFDFTTLSETVKIGTSVTGWTRSVNSPTTGSAPSSKSASGVIDTKENAWKDLTTRNKTDEQLKAMEIKDAVAAWDTMTTADKLFFYEDWEDRTENKKLDIDEEFEEYKKDSYESFNVDYEDLPIGLANPETPAEDKQPTTDEKGEKRDVDSQVLMIHNNNSIGTAQKYTSSSSVTVTAGSAAKVSIWVKTANLKTVNTNKDEQDAVGKGAYVNVSQSVGGKTLDTFEVKNIQADDWTEYTFYLKGSSFADSKFTLVLGLGQSGGTDHLGYVNGYAFFDNIQYEELTREAYDTATASVTGEAFLDSEKSDKVVDTYTSDEKTFAMNFYDKAAGVENAGWVAATNAFQSTTATPTKSTDGPGYNDELLAEVNGKDVFEEFANRSAIETKAASNKYLDILYKEYIKDTEDDNNFIKDDQPILMMLSSQGAAYTWENAYEFEMPNGTNAMAISFYVKTSDFKDGTGVTITLKNDRNDKSTSAFSSLNTANLEGVTVGGVEDYYDGWQRCYFFIEKSDDLKAKELEDGNGTTFTLDLNYGPTTLNINTSDTSFTPGMAAFTKFETLEMTTLEYGCATASTYAQKYSLGLSEEDKAAGNAGFDSAANTPSDALDKGLANAQNYKGVYSDSFYVNLPEASVDTDDARRKVNTYENAGILNRNNFTDPENDIVSLDTPWMNGLKSISGKTDATEIWNSVFGTSTQPLFIWNDGGAKSYGYIGSSTTMSSAYTAISIRVKTGGGAKASIYLVDMNDETRQTVLSVSDQLTYWYDDNGNVLDKEDGAVALRLDKKTGLYKIDKKWNATEYAKGEYFANLNAYTVGADGNLYANEKSATHAYHDADWKANRVVFYKHTDGAFYTKANGEGYKVSDFSAVANVATRYDGTNSASLSVTDLDTNDKWVNVTFYVKKGNDAKNYRLEVWSSATRAGAANPENSYVAFDMNNPGTASELYDSLLEEYKEVLEAKYPDGIPESVLFEGVFSYYDTDMHVRYEAALEEAYAKENDEKVVGNLYKDSFKASAQESAIAYLHHVDATDGDINVFVDYSLSDKSVVAATPDVDNDDTDTDTDTDTDEDGMNIFMLIGSIAVSAALVVALGGIATQRIMKYVKRRKASKARVNAVKKNK